MRITLISCLLLLTSCSVIMAGSKETTPVTSKEVVKLATEENFESKISNNVIETIAINESSYYKVYGLSYDSFAKIRMIIHASLDIATVGLWEVIATPGEANSNMSIYYVKIKYTNKKIATVEILEQYTLKKEAI